MRPLSPSDVPGEGLSREVGPARLHPFLTYLGQLATLIGIALAFEVGFLFTMATALDYAYDSDVAPGYAVKQAAWTKSTGINSITNYGTYMDATGSQTNYGYDTFHHGDVLLVDGNTTLGDASHDYTYDLLTIHGWMKTGRPLSGHASPTPVRHRSPGVSFLRR